MQRSVPVLLLGAAVLALGLGTLFLCSANRAQGAALDALHREIENLELRNARSRAAVLGHAPGDASALPEPWLEPEPRFEEAPLR